MPEAFSNSAGKVKKGHSWSAVEFHPFRHEDRVWAGAVGTGCRHVPRGRDVPNAARVGAAGRSERMRGRHGFAPRRHFIPGSGAGKWLGPVRGVPGGGRRRQDHDRNQTASDRSWGRRRDRRRPVPTPDRRGRSRGQRTAPGHSRTVREARSGSFPIPAPRGDRPGPEKNRHFNGLCREPRPGQPVRRTPDCSR